MSDHFVLDLDAATPSGKELDRLFREAQKEVTLDEIQRRAIERAVQESVLVLPSQEELVAQLQRPN